MNEQNKPKVMFPSSDFPEQPPASLGRKLADGGPAFPLATVADKKKQEYITLQFQSGMTLRDWFAGMAVGPLMASDGFEAAVMKDPAFDLETMLPQFAAQEAYRIADAMLAEREKGGAA